ncbi:MAG: hypothetical protein WCK25_01820 [Actinomycetes bacterium]|jgi:hypothetical protein
MTDFFDHEADEPYEDDEEETFEDEYYDEEDSLGAEAAILRVISEIERAKQLPLSSSVMVQRVDLLDLLNQALDALPVELAQAQQIIRDGEAILEAKEREASRLLEDVTATAQTMISRTEVVRMSQRRADEIIEEANEKARQLRHEADSFVERKLADMEIVVQRILKTVLSGREKLKPVVEVGQGPLLGDDLGEDDDSGNFFDQELQ